MNHITLRAGSRSIPVLKSMMGMVVPHTIKDISQRTAVTGMIRLVRFATGRKTGAVRFWWVPLVYSVDPPKCSGGDGWCDDC